MGVFVTHECALDAAMVQARRALKRGEVPIGAVIVRNGKIIARAHNMRESRQNALYHAETLAIMRACRRLKSWRLDDCDMYVTLEPCAMCMGAAVNARLRNVFFGAKSTSDLNWRTPATNLENPSCAQILKDFFRQSRT